MGAVSSRKPRHACIEGVQTRRPNGSLCSHQRTSRALCLPACRLRLQVLLLEVPRLQDIAPAHNTSTPNVRHHADWSGQATHTPYISTVSEDSFILGDIVRSPAKQKPVSRAFVRAGVRAQTYFDPSQVRTSRGIISPYWPFATFRCLSATAALQFVGSDVGVHHSRPPPPSLTPNSFAGQGCHRHLRRPVPGAEQRDPRVRGHARVQLRRGDHLRRAARLLGLPHARRGPGARALPQRPQGRAASADARVCRQGPQLRRDRARVSVVCCLRRWKRTDAYWVLRFGCITRIPWCLHPAITPCSSDRGGHDVDVILRFCATRGVNQLYIIGGDGTHRGAHAIYQEAAKRGIPMAVAAIPKTIDNDVDIIDRSFGFDSAYSEAQRAIKTAKTEAAGAPNGIGIVKVMGRYAGFIAAYATLASGDVDCVLVPELPIALEGPGSILEHLRRVVAAQGHAVVVVAEGAGEDEMHEETLAAGGKVEFDAGGNRKLPPVGPWLQNKIAGHFASVGVKATIKYIGACPSSPATALGCNIVRWCDLQISRLPCSYCSHTLHPPYLCRLTLTRPCPSQTRHTWSAQCPPRRRTRSTARTSRSQPCTAPWPDTRVRGHS